MPHAGKLINRQADIISQKEVPYDDNRQSGVYAYFNVNRRVSFSRHQFEDDAWRNTR